MDLPRRREKLGRFWKRSLGSLEIETLRIIKSLQIYGRVFLHYFPTFPVPLKKSATTTKPAMAVPKLNHKAPLNPLK